MFLRILFWQQCVYNVGKMDSQEMLFQYLSQKEIGSHDIYENRMEESDFRAVTKV